MEQSQLRSQQHPGVQGSLCGAQLAAVFGGRLSLWGVVSGRLAGSLLCESECSVRATALWAVELQPCPVPAMTRTIITTINLVLGLVVFDRH